MERTMRAGITVRGLRKTFGATHAVDGIDFEVPAGAFLVLLGPSGCGKTTTLRMLAGLEDPSAGTISFGDNVVADGDRGRSVPASQREVGMVFQSYALWPHMTVEKNISWPLRVARLGAKERADRAGAAMDMLSISELGARYPGEISGGQQQRVAIARTIAPRPAVLLFDEPLSNLDAKLRTETRSELMRVHRETGATSVYVTHDQVEAMTMATHVALMRDGRIEQLGTPQELVSDPATAFVAAFVGTPAANLLGARVDGGRLREVSTGLDVGTAPPTCAEGDTVQVMHRATSLTLHTAGSDPRRLAGTFVEATPMAGRWSQAIVLDRGERVTVVSERPAESRPGEPAWVVLPPEPDAVFDSTGARVREVTHAGRASVVDALASKDVRS